MKPIHHQVAFSVCSETCACSVHTNTCGCLTQEPAEVREQRPGNGTPLWVSQCDGAAGIRQLFPLFVCNGMFRFTISKLCSIKLVSAIKKSCAIT